MTPCRLLSDATNKMLDLCLCLAYSDAWKVLLARSKALVSCSRHHRRRRRQEKRLYSASGLVWISIFASSFENPDREWLGLVPGRSHPTILLNDLDQCKIPDNWHIHTLHCHNWDHDSDSVHCRGSLLHILSAAAQLLRLLAAGPSVGCCPDSIALEATQYRTSVLTHVSP